MVAVVCSTHQRFARLHDNWNQRPIINRNKSVYSIIVTDVGLTHNVNKLNEIRGQKWRIGLKLIY